VTFLPEPFGIMPAKLLDFFRGEILFFIGMQVFFHLSYDVLGIVIIIRLKVCRDFGYFVGMATGRAQFPFLEPIHVRKSPAPRTAEYMVHKYQVISASPIKTYGQIPLQKDRPDQCSFFYPGDSPARCFCPATRIAKRNPYIVPSTQ